MTRKLIICCLQSIIDIYEMSKNEKPWANVPIDSEDVEAIRLSIEKWGEQNAEPCEDAISRQAVMDALCHGCEVFHRNGDQVCSSYCEEYHFLVALPSVTPKQKMGRWVNGEYCSECGCDVPAYIIDWKWQKDMDAKYCPNCGAKMEESEGEK